MLKNLSLKKVGNYTGMAVVAYLIAKKVVEKTVGYTNTLAATNPLRQFVDFIK